MVVLSKNGIVRRLLQLYGIHRLLCGFHVAWT